MGCCSTFCTLIHLFLFLFLRQVSQEDVEDWESEIQGKSESRAFSDESFAMSSTPAKFYRLPLPLDRIFLIDDSRSLRKCLGVLCTVSLPCYDLDYHLHRSLSSNLLPPTTTAPYLNTVKTIMVDLLKLLHL